MLRRLYCLLLRLHPPYFRQRFANEMLLIFDEKTTADGRRAAARLMADGAASLARQWALRPRFWEQPARPVADGGPHPNPREPAWDYRLRLLGDRWAACGDHAVDFRGVFGQHAVGV